MTTTYPPQLAHRTRLDHGVEHRTTDGPLTVDLCTPNEVCCALDLDEGALLDLVNAAVLPAYRLAGAVRFRRCDVAALAATAT